LGKFLESNEMIKIKWYIPNIIEILWKKDYNVNRNAILNGDDIIKILDKTVNNNFILAETLLSLFEKNAFNYLDNIINSKKEIIKDRKKTVIRKLEDEPLDIFKDCTMFWIFIFLNLEIYSQNWKK
jgi:hypothetical protein